MSMLHPNFKNICHIGNTLVKSEQTWQSQNAVICITKFTTPRREYLMPTISHPPCGTKCFKTSISLIIKQPYNAPNVITNTPVTVVNYIRELKGFHTESVQWVAFKQRSQQTLCLCTEKLWHTKLCSACYKTTTHVLKKTLPGTQKQQQLTPSENS